VKSYIFSLVSFGSQAHTGRTSGQVAYLRKLWPKDVKPTGGTVIESVEDETQLLGGVLKSLHGFEPIFE